MKFRIRHLFVITAILTASVTASARPWSDTFEDFNDRFEPVIGSGFSAVWLDNETDLVWEWIPDANSKNYFAAEQHCFNRTIGNRGGWRLPEVHELRTMIDKTAEQPKIHKEYPFRDWAIKKSVYWTATTRTDQVNSSGKRFVQKWVVDMRNGNARVDDAINPGVSTQNKYYVWCVRAK